jgi:hypothetical protein
LRRPGAFEADSIQILSIRLRVEFGSHPNGSGKPFSIIQALETNGYSTIDISGAQQDGLAFAARLGLTVRLPCEKNQRHKPPAEEVLAFSGPPGDPSFIHSLKAG